jgi:hypothetical protein
MAEAWLEFTKGQRFPHPQSLKLDLENLWFGPNADNEINRMLWASRFLNIAPDRMYQLWCMDNLVYVEMNKQGVDPEQFDQISQTLGIHLLRNELNHFPYYLTLQHHLQRFAYGSKILLLGHTAGAEIEVIEGNGCEPHLCTPFSSSMYLCEERLLEDRVDFVSVCYEESEVFGHEYAMVVLSQWQPQPRALVSLAYEVIPEGGFVLASSKCCAAIEELDGLGMVRVPSQMVAAVLLQKIKHDEA